MSCGFHPADKPVGGDPAGIRHVEVISLSSASA